MRDKAYFVEEPHWRMIAVMLVKVRSLNVLSGLVLAIAYCVIEWNFSPSRMAGAYLGADALMSFAGAVSSFGKSALLSIATLAFAAIWIVGLFFLMMRFHL